MQDETMFLCAYYLQKGINPEQILSLTSREKRFYLAAASWYSDRAEIEE